MISLNYKTFGQGPAMLILHGLFGSLDNWVSFARQLDNKYSIFLIDQRNHGKSPHHNEWNYEIMAQDLEDFMDQQGIFQANILGHSMGGKTAMQFALNQPARVEKLIVADIAPKAYPPHHEQILNAITNLDTSILESRKDAKQALSNAINDDSVIQFLLKNLKRKDEGGFEWKFNLKVIYEKYEKVLEAIYSEDIFEGESLFIAGEKSDYIKSEDHAQILNLFPSAKFKTIPHAGHWVHADAPEQMLRIVDQFLSE